MAEYTDMSWEEITDRCYDKLQGRIKNKEHFYQWMKEREKVGYVFDPNMYGYLYYVDRERLSKRKDFVLVIVGKEGEGKTIAGLKTGATVNPEQFTNDQRCFEADEVLRNWKTCPPKTPIQIDEGGFILFSREAMKSLGVNIIKMFMAIRVKGYFHIICCPDYKSLDTYIRNHRVNMIIDMRPGFRYQAYIDEAIVKINQDIDKVKKISAVKVPNGMFWQGDFNAQMPKTINIEEYESKKIGHVNAKLDETLTKLTPSEQKFIPAYKISGELGLTAHGINKRIRAGVIKAHKIGGRFFLTMDEYSKLLNTPEFCHFKPPRGES